MRDVATVLGIIRDRGSRGLPLEDVYRQLFNPGLYLLAYGKISRNAGALTRGATDETVDGMSLQKIQAIIEQLRYERYRWTPVRRVYIEKKGSTKKRPLGIPTWSDKLLQEVVRLILEAYYEPQFSNASHGFRPQRGCGTALSKIYHTWKGTAWFIEGDIHACFDSFDHEVMLAILRERIHDHRFVRLMGNLLKAGYLEEWRYHKTLSGSPQGGIVSPILANIYLDRLDQFIEHTLIPTYTRGDKRKLSPAYDRLTRQIVRAQQQRQTAPLRRLRKERQRLPSHDTQDPNYRRLRYVRYADDWLLGFAGPRQEAEEIKQQIGAFLREHLKLELSEEKTRITHARTETARFLSYEVEIFQADSKQTAGRRSINAHIGLRVPQDIVRDKCRRYTANGKPIHRTELINDEVLTIVALYDAEYRGVVNYWRSAYNLNALGYLQYVMGTSLAKTLAAKLRLSVSQVWEKYRARYDGRKVLKVTVARAGKAPLVAVFPSTNRRWKPGTQLDDQPQPLWNGQHVGVVQRLLANTCELCGSQDRIEVHHIRALKDLQRPGRSPRPEWARVMAARRRKTLVLCHACHAATHAGQPRRQANTPRVTGEPDASKEACPVRRGADGKVPAA